MAVDRRSNIAVDQGVSQSSYRQLQEISESELFSDSDFEEVSESLLPEVVDWMARMILLKI